MKRPTNKQIVAILRRAKEHLVGEFEDHSAETSKYICYAIDFACQKPRSKFNQNHGNWIIDKVIMARIDPQGYAQGWLRKNYEDADEMYYTSHDKFVIEVQRWRHAWLDSLIEEFSK